VKRYLLDSTPLTAYLTGRPHALELIRPWIAEGEVATSILVYGEVEEFIKSFPDYPRRHAALRTLLRDIHPYLLTYAILDRYADLRRQLRRPYGPGTIGDIDTLIAATAIERNLTLVTTDSDFQRVPDMMLLQIPRSAFAR